MLESARKHGPFDERYPVRQKLPAASRDLQLAGSVRRLRQRARACRSQLRQRQYWPGSPRVARRQNDRRLTSPDAEAARSQRTRHA